MTMRSATMTLRFLAGLWPLALAVAPPGCDRGPVSVTTCDWVWPDNGNGLPEAGAPDVVFPEAFVSDHGLGADGSDAARDGGDASAALAETRDGTPAPDGVSDATGPRDAPQGDADPTDVLRPEFSGLDGASPGQFGAACAQNGDCASGWCIAHPGGYLCTRLCSEGGCPAGWGCVPVQNTAPDYQYVCQPVDTMLCQPCTADRQCGQGYCLTGTSGATACTRPCNDNLPCPAGYDCRSATSEFDQRLVSDQCIPVSGVCDCGPGEADQTRPCYLQNGFGLCWGEERCDPERGWVDCTAPAAAAEVCDGRDQNCDGVADDEPEAPGEPCQVENQFGLCSGTWRCLGLDGWDCDAATPSAETCDYQDNDCDGGSDEDFRAAADGAYDRLEHCGACGYDCTVALPFVAEARCVAGDPGAAPYCAVVRCSPGYEKPADAEICVPATTASDCSPCASDVHCAELPGTCEAIDGGRHCARTCAAPDECPAGYECVDTACLPLSRSCTCHAGTAGDERDCLNANENGVCGGTQVCWGDAGWSPCSAATPQSEECDGADNDCDGTTDEAGALGCAVYYRDGDDDGAGLTVDFGCYCAAVDDYRASVGGDCEDGDARVYPGAVESCNGRDDNCTGGVDEAGAEGCTLHFRDGDGDGHGLADDSRCLCGPLPPYTATRGDDCDDHQPQAFPGATESCDGLDNDCDRLTDEAGAVDCTPHFADGDGDGYGAEDTALCGCGPDLQHPVAVGGDCDDTDDAIHPAASEICNEQDDNCDGRSDEEDAVGCVAYYRDADDDSYGVPYSARCLCAPDGDDRARRGGDCDDDDDRWVPGGTETCGSDADCCLDTTACRYGLCVPSPTPCTTTDDCDADRYCDGGECIPWGIGPGGHFDDRCERPSVPGLFHPTIQCAWSGPPVGDPFPNHINVLSTPTVVDFDFDNDPTTVRPSIVFTSYNYTDGGAYASDGAGSAPDSYWGVIRVLDGATCAQQYNVSAFRVVGSNPLALGDIDLDGRPEIAAHGMGGGLVVFRYNPTANAFALLWEGHTAGGATHRPYASVNRWNGPSITDLDGDEVPELLMATYVYNNLGVVQATNLGTHQYSQGHLPVVADVDLDGAPELVMGDGVYRYATDAGGAHSWQRESYNAAGTDGLVALGDFGDFPVAGLPADIPEIVVISSGSARIMNLAGQTVFGPYLLPFFPPATDRGTGGPPTVGDFDGDGRPEFALAGRGAYTIFDVDCAVTPLPPSCWGQGILWALPSQDYSSSITGSSIFDFEGDGYAEAVYADECFTRIYRGIDGEVLFSQWRTSCTWYENPIVADVDGDGYSEIVTGSNTNCGTGGGCPQIDPYFRGLRCESASECLSGECNGGYCRCTADAHCGGSDFVCTSPIPNTPGSGNVCRARHPRTGYGGLRVYRDALDNWVNSRTIWNQHAYFATNIGDDGRVPAFGESATNWATAGLNNFRQNVQGTLPGTLAADITVRPLALDNCDVDGALRLEVRVCNRGAAPPQGPVAVTYYDGDPEVAPVVCLAETSGALAPGMCETVGCAWNVMPPAVPHDITVVADSLARERECREANNRVLLPAVTCTNLP